MKEFISLLISFVFMGIADNIDSAFNNAISVKVPKAVKEEIDKKTRDIFALTNRGIIATFNNLPEFIKDIKIEEF